jgi:hypothetical protein
MGLRQKIYLCKMKVSSQIFSAAIATLTIVSVLLSSSCLDDSCAAQNHHQNFISETVEIESSFELKKELKHELSKTNILFLNEFVCNLRSSLTGKYSCKTFTNPISFSSLQIIFPSHYFW